MVKICVSFISFAAQAYSCYYYEHSWVFDKSRVIRDIRVIRVRYNYHCVSGLKDLFATITASTRGSSTSLVK